MNIPTALAATDVRSKATAVSRIFTALSWAILGVGAVLEAVLLIGVLATAITSSPGEFMIAFLVAAVATFVNVVYTALMWASVSLAVIVAQYIASRS